MFNLNELKNFFGFFKNGDEKIILFGTGQFAQIVYEDIKSIGIKIEYCIDNNSTKWGSHFNNIEIKDPMTLKNENKNKIYIIIASMYYKEISEQLQTLGVINYINGKEFVAKKLVLSQMDVRELVGRLWLLEGKGIEIGALHAPLPLNKNLEVQYVDVTGKNVWKEVYKDKNYADSQIVKVDVIDNAEKLTNFENDSLDFIIANHVIEHTLNPIGTIETFMKKLKRKGKVFLCVPDKRFTFDQKREVTSFEHLLKDYEDDGENSKYMDYKDYVTFVKNVEENKIEAVVAQMMENNENIHFHVWDSQSWLLFLIKVNNFLNQIFEIKHLQQNGNEVICVLEKV